MKRSGTERIRAFAWIAQQHRQSATRISMAANERTRRRNGDEPQVDRLAELFSFGHGTFSTFTDARLIIVRKATYLQDFLGFRRI